MAADLVFHKDRFEGILIDVSKQTIDADEFADKLKGCISEWAEQGKRGLWVTIPAQQSKVIPQLVQMGLDFHHANPGYVCMTKWLAPNVPNHLPSYANHCLGAGGFVVNSSNQILAIKELFHVRNKINMWKLPGGAVDAGEDIPDAAKREVYEETGVQCELVCVLGYRHMHNFRHGCSDIYVVCLMKPLTQEIKACPNEIAECTWMDLEEYEKSGLSVINRYFVQKYRDYLTSGVAIGVKDVLSYNNKVTNKVYSGGKVEASDVSESNNGASSDQEVNELCPV